MLLNTLTSAAAGRCGQACNGTLTTARSPAAPASALVAARASGPSSSTRPFSVSGPRELLRTTWCPAATLSRATVLPIMPLPMKPTLVMPAATAHPSRIIPRSADLRRWLSLLLELEQDNGLIVAQHHV